MEETLKEIISKITSLIILAMKIAKLKRNLIKTKDKL